MSQKQNCAGVSYIARYLSRSFNTCSGIYNHFISQAISKDFTKINVRLVPLNIFGTSKTPRKLSTSHQRSNTMIRNACFCFPRWNCVKVRYTKAWQDRMTGHGRYGWSAISIISAQTKRNQTISNKHFHCFSIPRSTTVNNFEITAHTTLPSWECRMLLSIRHSSSVNKKKSIRHA